MKNPARGVYALTHIATGMIYVGSSMNFRRRWKERRQRMNTNQHQLPPEIRVLTASREDWKFSILWDGTGATPAQLEAAERRGVELVRAKAPSRLLNILAVQRPDAVGFTAGDKTMSLNAWSKVTGIPRATIAARKNYGWTPEQCVGLAARPYRDYPAGGLLGVNRQHSLSMMATAIRGDDGEYMLIGEAAAELGCRYETLARRLAARRARQGGEEITLAELRALSDKYRRRV
jgi:hypothetical protein